MIKQVPPISKSRKRDEMENRILKTVGTIAGLGGLALGVLLILFQGVLATKFLPDIGLTSEQAYQILLALMLLTFGIAAIGVIAWIIAERGPPGAPP